MPLRRIALAVALAAFPAWAHAASVVRGPFLQRTQPTSTTVVVLTDSAAAVSVEATDDQGATVRGESPSGTRHLVALHGLSPATRYTYRVLLGGSPSGAAYAFRTPGVPGTAAGGHAVLGFAADQGSGGANAKANADRMVERGVQAVITAGDLAMPDGAPEQWDPMFFKPFAKLVATSTFWPTIGDHEYNSGGQGYFDAFVLPQEPGKGHYYSFDWGDLHIASLDYACWDPPSRGAICDAAAMATWLEADMKASKAPWKLVTIHRAAVSSGKYLSVPKISSRLIPIAESAGIDLVLQAHSHSYERTWPVRGSSSQVVQKGYANSGAPVYMTSGGAGDWIYEPGTATPPAWSAFRATEFHHLVLTLDCGALKVEAIRPDGTTLDQFTLTKRVSCGPETLPGETGSGGTPTDPDPQTPPTEPGSPTGPSSETPGYPSIPGASRVVGCSTAGTSLALAPLGLLGLGLLVRRSRRGKAQSALP